MMISLASVSRVAVGPTAPMTLLPIGLIVPELPTLGSIEGESDGAILTRGSGITVPPHPDDASPIDAAPFARQAGLHEKAGATVVLRVEVLGNGAVGRVEVDVSGGNRRIDQAAIAYVRAMKWVGGRLDDQPQTLWVRWGVRLQDAPMKSAAVPARDKLRLRWLIAPSQIVASHFTITHPALRSTRALCGALFIPACFGRQLFGCL
jgi:TonB family protein